MAYLDVFVERKQISTTDLPRHSLKYTNVKSAEIGIYTPLGCIINAGLIQTVQLLSSKLQKIGTNRIW